MPKLQENSRKLRIFIKIQGISNEIHRDVVDLDFFEGNLGGSDLSTVFRTLNLNRF